MATVRVGGQAALVVVDVQVGVMAQAWDAERIVGNVERAVARAREQQVPVVWVQHSSDELKHGTPEWQWVPQLQAAPGEPLIHKHFNSAFKDTTLEAELAKRGVSHIVLAGASSNWCIRATAYGALDRGYDLTLVKDAHSTESMQMDDGSTIEAKDIVRELNVAMTWLSYPGRKNATAKAEEVDFASRG